MNMDAASLRGLGRPALQKLAMSRKIKGNLKTEHIIELLLRHFSEENQIASPRSPPHDIADAGLLEAPAAVGRQTYPPGPSTPEIPSHSINSTYTFATPDSSIANSPEPEALPILIDNVLEITTEVERIDENTLRRLADLRSFTAQLCKKAFEMGDILRAERGMRIRLEEYLVYWRRINPKWDYDEVWSGPIRVKDMYTGHEVSTSDEEDIVADFQFASGDEPQGSVTNTSPARKSRTSSMAKSLATSLEAGGEDPSVSNHPGRKRKRLPDVEVDDSMRHPRPRQHQPSRDASAPTPPLARNSLGKGKGKMSPEDVEYSPSQLNDVVHK